VLPLDRHRLYISFILMKPTLKPTHPPIRPTTHPPTRIQNPLPSSTTQVALQSKIQEGWRLSRRTRRLSSVRRSIIQTMIQTYEKYTRILKTASLQLELSAKFRPPKLGGYIAEPKIADVFSEWNAEYEYGKRVLQNCRNEFLNCASGSLNSPSAPAARAPAAAAAPLFKVRNKKN